MKTLFKSVAVLCGLFSVSSLSAHDAAGEMAAAAEDFLKSLSEEQRELATFSLNDAERENWHYVPKPFEGEKMRRGVTLKSLEPAQRHLAYGLLSTGLSHQGYLKAIQIMSLEQILWEMEQDPKRDTEMYYLTIFGEPGATAWGWRFEGHHLSLNFTIKEGHVVSSTPSFYATNPAKVPEGPRQGLRVLAGEEDQARALVKSLDEQQAAKGIFEKKAPREILTAAESRVDALGDEGIKYADLNEAQQDQLIGLIETYLRRARHEVADDELAAIHEAGLDSIRFAWAGGTEPGEPHYYRVQGETFLLEYANTQNGANHVHAVWREFDGDFGRDLLGEHYAKHHAE
ncbi:MAG: DUF3500 domain-containing protein [Verrucomicrobiota bacterium]